MASTRKLRFNKPSKVAGYRINVKTSSLHISQDVLSGKEIKKNYSTQNNCKVTKCLGIYLIKEEKEDRLQ